MIRPEEVNINIDDMKIMEMPKRAASNLSVTINEQGCFTVSSAFLEKLKQTFPTLDMEIRRSEDSSILVFCEPKRYQFRLFKTGRFKYMEFMEELKRQGYQLPAKYLVGWNSNLNAWVGVLQEVEKAPDVRSLAKRDGMRSKASKGRSNEK